MNTSWLAFSEMIVSIEVLFCACYISNIFHLKLSGNNGFSQGKLLFCACYISNIFHLKLSDNNGYTKGLATSQLPSFQTPFSMLTCYKQLMIELGSLFIVSSLGDLTCSNSIWT